MASITSNYGLSKPLGSEAPDISVINDNMDTLDSELVVKTSNDIADATATKSTGWTTVPPVAVGEKVASVFEKFSTMAKNIRWIYKFLGTADISSIGDGTVTNALTTLNTAVGKKVNTVDIVNNLTSTSTTQPLSANMGKALNDALTNAALMASNSYIGKSMLTARNDQLTFANGTATKDISSIYRGSESFGFFFFPYNANDVGVMHIMVNNGVATFNTEGTNTSGTRYVNWLILLPRISK